MTAEAYRFFSEYLATQSVIILDPGKEYLLQSRLAPVLKREGIADLTALCLRLKNQPSMALRDALVESMTNHETLFFRDDSAFGVLESKVLPDLIKSRPPSWKLRIWSAASSSGQEAYSIAMLLIQLGVDPARVEILGTDISRAILQKARTGIYGDVEMARGVPARLKDKYFRKIPEGWELAERIRYRVRFQQIDLRQISGQNFQYDLILCRNVLIYFDRDTKSKIFGNLASALAQGGYLLLGAAETAIQLAGPLTPVIIGSTTFYRQKGS